MVSNVWYSILFAQPGPCYWYPNNTTTWQTWPLSLIIILLFWKIAHKAAACITSLVETGEAPCVALVPSTRISDYVHTAEQLARHKSFLPKAMWSDLFPNWFLNLAGFLWTKCARSPWIVPLDSANHKDTSLKAQELHKDNSCTVELHLSIYPADHKGVVKALKDETMNGLMHTDGDITDLDGLACFKTGIGSIFAKFFYPIEINQARLDMWYNDFKATASEGWPDAEERVDPLTGVTPFTADIKGAVEQGKASVVHVLTKLPLDDV